MTPLMIVELGGSVNLNLPTGGEAGELRFTVMPRSAGAPFRLT